MCGWMFPKLISGTSQVVLVQWLHWSERLTVVMEWVTGLGMKNARRKGVKGRFVRAMPRKVGQVRVDLLERVVPGVREVLLCPVFHG